MTAETIATIRAAKTMYGATRAILSTGTGFALTGPVLTTKFPCIAEWIVQKYV